MDDLVITEQLLNDMVLNCEISPAEEEQLKKELFNSKTKTESSLGGKSYDANSTKLRSNNRGHDRVQI